MNQRMISILMTLSILLPLTVRAHAEAVTISAPSAILMEASSGEILYESNDHERLAPASVTKVMTLLLVMEALEGGRISWEDTVTVSSAAAAKGGSQVYLEEGEQMPFIDMMKAVVISSANDCATALAEHVSGSESAFVDKMNARAAEMGLTDTHFVNCTGLDDDPNAKEHLTTAHDVAVMSRELLRHERIKDYTTIWMDTVRGGKFGLSNTNKLVRFYEGTTGLKTGFTSAAGHCLAASAQRDGMELIAVVMHCASSTDRFQSAKALMDYGFANYALISATPDTPLTDVPVTLGNTDTVTPILADNTPILIDKGLRPDVTCKTTLMSCVAAPVEAGQQLGTMTISVNGEILSERAIVAANAVGHLTWWQVMGEILRGVCMTA